MKHCHNVNMSAGRFLALLARNNRQTRFWSTANGLLAFIWERKDGRSGTGYETPEGSVVVYLPSSDVDWTPLLHRAVAVVEKHNSCDAPYCSSAEHITVRVIVRELRNLANTYR